MYILTERGYGRFQQTRFEFDIPVQERGIRAALTATTEEAMAAADTLYGVTQEESGVSKRIAVRFEAAAAAVARPAKKAA